MGQRVWVIGLDGATFDLIAPWVQAGHLPTFARLMEQGCWGEVRSTVPPITGPAWLSFMTGTNPGKHGVFDFTYRRPGTYDFPPTTGENNRQPSLWQILGQAGKRCLVLNVPMTYPPEPINGVLVSGMPATELVTYPPELADRIRAQIPDYVVYPDPGQAYSDQGIATFIKQVKTSIEGSKKLWRDLIGLEKWDFAMLLLNATDTVQHALWKFMSADHPQYDPHKAKRYGNAILEVYQACDAFLAEVMAELEDDTVLWVMSDHGFGPFHKFFHVNTWLMQAGLMSIRPGPLAHLKAFSFRLGFSPMVIYNILMNIGLGKLKRAVVRGRSQKLRRLFLSFDDVDWKRTVAYSLGNIGQIRVNVKGREPHGIVEPGSQYDQVVTDLIARLSQLRDPKNNELVVEHIYRRDEIYTGDAFEDAPDILFLPRRLEYFGFGEYEFGDHRVIVPVERGISGTHRMNGIGLAWGAFIRPGKLEQARLEDLSPTILHLLGEPIPAHMDGRPLLEVLSDQAGFPVPSQAPAWDGKQPSSMNMSQDEEERIRQRLKDLGYVA
ncbi:MAG: alkaline phosphatase family protein [Anaerolineales bacterium]|nr:alkaline phosphatase family protein [Anaerolineales bacterium]